LSRRHILHAVIGNSPAIENFSNRWVSAHPIALPQNFAIVPLTEGLCDDIDELMDLSEPPPFVGFDRLSASVATDLRESSRFGALGYIETNYVGSSGTQSAIAWSNGNILAGAFTSEMMWDVKNYQPTATGKSAIDRVLSALGVWTHHHKDEFEMLGLANFSDTESVASNASLG
jgi:hypothetical protein